MLKLKLQYFGHLMRRVDSLEKPWCWEGLGAEGEGDDRGWDGWMASPTLWTWVWVNPWSWWWTGRHGVLRFMGSQRVGHDWATELHWTECGSAWSQGEGCKVHFPYQRCELRKDLRGDSSLSCYWWEARHSGRWPNESESQLGRGGPSASLLTHHYRGFP